MGHESDNVLKEDLWPRRYHHIPFRPKGELKCYKDYLRMARDIKTCSQDMKEFGLRLTTEISRQFYHKPLVYVGDGRRRRLLDKVLRTRRWKDLLYVYDKNQIARSKHAVCNQTSILVASLCIDMGIKWWKVGFSWDAGKYGHYAIAIRDEDAGMYILDPNMMPRLAWDGKDIRRLINEQTREYAFAEMYGSLPDFPPSAIADVMVTIDRGERPPAENARRAQIVFVVLGCMVVLFGAIAIYGR